MKLLLANGTELAPLVVIGGGKYINGSKRDTLNFIFPENTSLDEMDSIFTADNCKTIKLTDDEGNEYIYSGYVIRASLSRTPVEVKEATDTEEAVYENRVTVSMALQNYLESELTTNTEVLQALLTGEE